MNISNKELRQLLFWAHVGTYDSKGGTFRRSIPKTIVKYAKKLNLTPRDFCLFKNAPYGTLGAQVYKEWKNARRRN